MFSKKDREPATKLFDDDEWIGSLTEAETITADIAEGQVTYAIPNGTVRDQSVRPVQMGEFLRKYVSRRLLALSEGEIAALMTAMRRVGVGSQGGAEDKQSFTT